jgi:tocopherol O-methyltransferase
MTAGVLPFASAAATLEAVARHYDELDPFYRDVWGEHVHHGLWRRGDETLEQAVAGLIDLVAATAGVRGGSEVVDVGAGYGSTARHLAARFGARVTGLTISRAQHAFAERAREPAGVRILLQDWLANTLPAASADAVIAIESTEHMADLPRALDEMHRVLRPGGRVVVCAWLSGDAPSAWQRRWLLDLIVRDGRLASLMSAAEYGRLLQRAGFVAVGCEDLTSAVARTWSVCLRRLVHRAALDRRYLRYLLDRANGERAFLAAMARIAAAYASGAMRYAMFAGQRPTEPQK